MKPSEYQSARDTLGWTNERLAEVMGVSERVPYRYANGDVTIPGPAARLLRLLVMLQLTTSKPKFEQLIERLG